jgi:hypothetical protein
MTETGKQEAGHTDRATTVPRCIGCCSDEWISHASRVLLPTDTTAALQLPLSYICFTHCVFTVRFLSGILEGILLLLILSL